MSDYTPTTEDVRGMFGDIACNRLDLEMEGHDSGCPADLAFDRWLAEHDRQLKAQAWAEGAFDAALSLGHGGHNATNPYKEEA